MTSLHAELSGPHKFCKKINIIFFQNFVRKTPLYLCWCLQRENDCGTVAQSSTIMFTLYWSLWMMRMINDEPLNWLWLFLFSLFYPLVRPGHGHGPSWLSRLVYLTCSALCSLSLSLCLYTYSISCWFTPQQEHRVRFRLISRLLIAPDVWCD